MRTSHFATDRSSYMLRDKIVGWQNEIAVGIFVMNVLNKVVMIIECWLSMACLTAMISTIKSKLNLIHKPALYCLNETFVFQPCNF